MSEFKTPPMNMGLQLFPPPPKNKKNNPFRKGSVRRNGNGGTGQTPLQERTASPAFTSDGRQSSIDGGFSSMGRQTPQTGRDTPQQDYVVSPVSPIQAPPQAHILADIPRSHTSFSEAPTLVRSNSNSSHVSIARNGLSNGSPPRDEPIMRSIFPRYNPDLALEHQAYYPTASSPTHIPRTIMNRPPYSPSFNERSPNGLHSPMTLGASPGRFPAGVRDSRSSVMEVSSNDEMKDLWKAVNGWRVSPSEGRTFCLKMTSAVEEPVHTLSSATQAFYTLKLIPTSSSAQMTLLRHDPSKSPKATGSGSGPGSPRVPLISKSSSAAMEVMATTIEETSRRLPPNDGLVALLYPRAASDMVIELANKPGRADGEQIVAAAERECGRLVWDEDSKKYYLVHPSISTPFIVSISSSPAWSRVEYTLEHSELPRNLVRLVRDGAGSGFLEIDTGAAAKIDAFYVVDVAICAVMLVALTEEKTRHVERFDAPPSLPPSPHTPKRNSNTWTIGKKGKKGKEKDKGIKFEEFEMDLESQAIANTKTKKQKEKEEKIPGFFGLIWQLIKCFVWTITMCVKGLAKIIIFLSSCLSKK